MTFECGNRESNLWSYQTCDVKIAHDPVYDNGLAGRARARALQEGSPGRRCGVASFVFKGTRDLGMCVSGVAVVDASDTPGCD